MLDRFFHRYSLVLSILLTAAMVCVSCSDDDDDEVQLSQSAYPPVTNNANDASKDSRYARLEFPKLKGGTNNMVIIHSTSDAYGVNYAVEWDVAKKASRWTAYQMRKGFTGNAGYYGTFEEDPDLDVKYRLSNTSSIYSGSGFTRGHICPSADRQYSKAANHQTFYYTNMQPQYYNFNAGEGYTSPWVRLENQVRTWTKAQSTEVLYVVKGGTIEDHQLLKNSRYPEGKIKGVMPIPKYFFVALLLKNAEGYKAIGFWMEHSNKAWNGSESLGSFAMNIRDLEQLTGIDFFCNLPDDVENHVETLPVVNIKRAWGL